MNSAWGNMCRLASLISENPCSILMPVLPSAIDISKGDINKADKSRPYYQQLAKECFDITDDPGDPLRQYCRIDNQMVDLINKVKPVVSKDTGKACDDKVIMFGYSSSGCFAERMYALHPEIMDTLLVGGASSEIPVIEPDVVKDHGYPLIIDREVHKKLTGTDDFNMNAYRSVKQIYFMAEHEFDTKTESRCTDYGEQAPMHDMTYMDRSIHSDIGHAYRDRFREYDKLGPEKRAEGVITWLRYNGCDVYNNKIIKGCYHQDMIANESSRREAMDLYNDVINGVYDDLPKTVYKQEKKLDNEARLKMAEEELSVCGSQSQVDFGLR